MLEAGRYTGPTAFHIDVGPFGQFQIFHVPDDGNCLFTAIGHFVGADQETVRWRIHDYALDILNGIRANPNPGFLTQEVIQEIIEGRAWGGEDEARMAAIVFRRRVFIIDRDYTNRDKNVPNVDTVRGFDANGDRIDMEQLDRPINPGQDIVLYFMMDPDGDPEGGGRHIEALIQPR